MNEVEGPALRFATRPAIVQNSPFAQQSNTPKIRILRPVLHTNPDTGGA
jgi:hypothetical protein